MEGEKNGEVLIIQFANASAEELAEMVVILWYLPNATEASISNVTQKRDRSSNGQGVCQQDPNNGREIDLCG